MNRAHHPSIIRPSRTAILAMVAPTIVVLAMQKWFVRGLVETEK
jgi:ABC-type maltose transport system permease subunit